MKNPLSLEAFADWCEAKEPTETYYYMDGSSCACAQYCRHLGIEYFPAMRDIDGDFLGQIEELAAAAAMADSTTASHRVTFHSLAHKTRELIAERKELANV